MDPSRDNAFELGDSGKGSVGIVGAGISGLSAASALADRGLHVRVFDKARGVGGRTSVRRERDLHFDHGAQYFTVRDPRFHRRVAAWMGAGVVREWAGRIVTLENGRVGPTEPQSRYVGVPGMSAIAKHMAGSLAVTTQTLVASVTRRGGVWLLYDSANQELGSFEVLIVALPAAQAADLLAGSSQLAERARACPLTPCWAVMVAFETRFDVPFDGAFVHNSPLSWIARNSSKPGRAGHDCWILHASPEWSSEHIEDSAETVCDELTEALRRSAGSKTPRSKYLAAHRWRYALPPEPLTVGCLWDEATGVAVCGDWCQGARIEGAFLSGLAAAERIMNAMGVTPNAT